MTCPPTRHWKCRATFIRSLRDERPGDAPDAPLCEAQFTSACRTHSPSEPCRYSGRIGTLDRAILFVSPLPLTPGPEKYAQLLQALARRKRLQDLLVLGNFQRQIRRQDVRKGACFVDLSDRAQSAVPHRAHGVRVCRRAPR